MPRHTTITPEIQDQYSAMLGIGLSRRRAAWLLGFSESTVRSAMRRDEKFADDVLRAERRREILALRNVQEAGNKSWRASKWFLERINPGAYVNPTNEARLERQVEQSAESLTDLILSEVDDPVLRRRIVDKLRRIRGGLGIIGRWNENLPPRNADDNSFKRYIRFNWLESMAQVDEEDAPPGEPANHDQSAAPWDGPHI